MSSIISTRSAQAFNCGHDFKLANTEVYKGTMYLHGNKIAWRDSNGNVCFCLYGWDTQTTRARLRAIGLPINHKQGQLYYADIKINDEDEYNTEDLNK